jgi:hypothetical protein
MPGKYTAGWKMCTLKEWRTEWKILCNVFNKRQHGKCRPRIHRLPKKNYEYTTMTENSGGICDVVHPSIAAEKSVVFSDHLIVSNTGADVPGTSFSNWKCRLQSIKQVTGKASDCYIALVQTTQDQRDNEQRQKCQCQSTVYIKTSAHRKVKYGLNTPKYAERN